MVRDTKGNVSEQNKKIQSYYARQTRSQSSKIENIENENALDDEDSSRNEDNAKKRKFVDYETTENLYENFGMLGTKLHASQVLILTLLFLIIFLLLFEHA